MFHLEKYNPSGTKNESSSYANSTYDENRCK